MDDGEGLGLSRQIERADSESAGPASAGELQPVDRMDHDIEDLHVTY